MSQPVTLYVKQGRRYRVWGNAESYDSDLMRAGQFRLVHCPEDGRRRYRYDVTPDTAAFLAACEVAEEAMEQAIKERVMATPSQQERKYSQRQLAIIEKFRRDMAEAGGLVPDWWRHSAAHEIASAAVEVVRAVHIKQTV